MHLINKHCVVLFIIYLIALYQGTSFVPDNYKEKSKYRLILYEINKLIDIDFITCGGTVFHYQEITVHV